jgi:hypothetical protein
LEGGVREVFRRDRWGWWLEWVEWMLRLDAPGLRVGLELGVRFDSSLGMELDWCSGRSSFFASVSISNGLRYVLGLVWAF